MINIPSNSTPLTLESVLRDIRVSPGQALKMATRFERGGAFGFSVQAIQVLHSWARSHTGTREIHLPPAYAESEDVRRRFASHPIGMVALYLADVVRAGTKTIHRPASLLPVVPFVEAMQSQDYRSTSRGTGALLVCFENARNEFLVPLYSKRRRGSKDEPAVRSVTSMTKTVSDMLDSAREGVSTKLSETQLVAIASLLYQLFSNADVHTRWDELGVPYSFGARGILIQAHRFLGAESIHEYVEEDRALLSYLLRSESWRRNRAPGTKDGAPRTSSTYIELSVFDAGPGLALRWLSEKHNVSNYRELTADDELSALKTCFELHSTTQGSGYVGDGLHIALKAIQQLKGFMALRSGRISLFQDFSSSAEGAFEPKIRNKRQVLNAETTGASFTICFPVPN